jgi:hypothetical protein
MKFIKDIEIGDIIKGTNRNRNIEGKVIKKLPGAVIVIDTRTERQEVISIENIKN